MNLNNIYFKVLLVFNIMVIRMIGILLAIMVMRTGEGKWKIGLISIFMCDN